MLEAVIEFMTTFHESGRRGAYGWVYVVLVLGLIGSAVAAKGLIERRKRLLRNTEKHLVYAPMVAAVSIESCNGKARVVKGRIQVSGKTYVLKICESVGDWSTESEHNFSTIEQVEQFLEDNTALRIRDFRQA